MLVVPHATQQKRKQDPAAQKQAQAAPVGMWSQLSGDQQQRLSQIIVEMMRCRRAAQVGEVKHDGDGV